MRGFRSLQSCVRFNVFLTCASIEPHLKKIRDDKVDLVGLWSPIANEEEVNHYEFNIKTICRASKDRLTLFNLKQRSTQALNDIGKQGRHFGGRQWLPNLRKGEKLNWLSLPIVMFATIFLSAVFRLTNFLSFVSAAWSSARNSYISLRLIRTTKLISTTTCRPRFFHVGRTSHLGQVEPSWTLFRSLQYQERRRTWNSMQQWWSW
jgi:hypothetical protein